ncbi:MAG: DUF2231 domain-containing protein [Deltaproteobacteria bacterium]|nr:DUF2231 domain-containing protein [Deltaproteobacteria bacterium]MBW2072220.1 DUF2231 domain-containing protein [Deltaproteobacteria bacterium]
MAADLKKFSRDELKEFNGTEGKPVYIAHEGKVYDVSESKLWRTGIHMRRHHSGEDLSEDFKAAPHGPEVFERFVQVGVLRAARDPMDEHLPDFLLSLFQKVPMLRRHPHPMTVHFPIAFVILTVILNVVYLITGQRHFEQSAFHVLGAALLATPVAMITGPYNWWINYRAKWSPTIVVKVAGSLFLLALIVILFVWRLGNPEIMQVPGGMRALYLLLVLALAPVVTVVGWFGAKMTFPH